MNLNNQFIGLTKIVASTSLRSLHTNRASICRIRRPKDEYCRQYPVAIVFPDGSTVTARHQVPREIIKLPFLFEDCITEVERRAWLKRRKPTEVIEIKKDDTDVAFDQFQYIKTMKKGASKK